MNRTSDNLETIDPGWAWATFGPTAKRPWNRALAGHLYRRAGFAATSDELDLAERLQPAEVVELLLQPGEEAARIEADMQALDQVVLAGGNVEGLPAWWLYRMRFTGDPLLEKLTLFLHGHFATSAAKGFVYIRSEYPHAFRQMVRAIHVAHEAGLLGDDVLGSGRSFHLEARLGAGAYICGEETSLLESLEGRRGQIRFKPPLPAIAGLFGRPTVVNNVISLASVPWILANGAEAYRDYGMGRSRGTMPIQLAGNIRHGGLIERAFGLTLHELVMDLGGGTATGRPVRAVQVGGPLGAYWPTSLFDTPLDYEEFARMGGMVGHGGIVVFDDTVDLARRARFAFRFCAEESCGKCTPCRIGSTRGAETIDRIIKGERVAENLRLVDDLCEVMTDGSLCALGGLTPVPVQSAIRHFPEDFDRAALAAAAE